MMADNTNIKNLRKLLAFLKQQILSNPQNKWFAKDLYDMVAPITDTKISDIHEQCIELILKQQAEEFYKDFPLEEIKPQLISDFEKMLLWQRRNNFQEFCLALYQQIESIVNYLCHQEAIRLVWRNIRNANFFVDLKAKSIIVRGNGMSIKQSVIYKEENRDKDLNNLPAMDKFKVILFLIVYQTNVNWNNKHQYNSDFNMGYDIYMMRNLNHRGGDISDYQNSRTQKVSENLMLSMIEFLGFYSKFVSGINKGYALTTDIIEFAELCCQQSYSVSECQQPPNNKMLI